MQKYPEAAWFRTHEYPEADKLSIIIEGTQATGNLQCSTAFHFDNVEEGRRGQSMKQEDVDSHIPVDPMEYNSESPNTFGANIPTTPLESNNNSRNVGGAFMEDTDRATSSRARSETPSGVKHRKKKENKTTELCNAVNNVAEATREKML